MNYEFPVDELAVAEEAALQTMGGADVKFVDGEYNGLGQGHGGDITVKVVSPIPRLPPLKSYLKMKLLPFTPLARRLCWMPLRLPTAPLWILFPVLPNPLSALSMP